MAYPSLEQYNEALQSPRLVLQDPELKAGQVKTTGLGLPLALCGGFALTYSVNVGTKRFALRCFHKESRDLERRYQAIAARLHELNSPYFLPFEFISNGIRIQGQSFPIVKMAWAEGRTLAEFLESEHRNGPALTRLRLALSNLAEYLEQNGVAHGDIQPENVMVRGEGSSVQLIDYDGLFVETLRGSNATELGQINFQHPGRTAADFNERLDRFSFISLDVALQALIASPGLWASSRSEPSALVFRRNDLLDPAVSTVFRDIIQLPDVNAHAQNLAKVGLAGFDSVPTLTEFLQGKLGSAAGIVFKPRTTPVALAYQGPYPVCNATDFASLMTQVGNRVELVGQIHSVKKGWGANKRPYVFVNFSDWRGQAIKLAIWSDGMKAIEPNIPDDSWVGRWVSVTGLVDPAYRGKAKSASYLHLSITVTSSGQIQTLSKEEGEFRLRSPMQSVFNAPTPHRSASIPTQNSAVVNAMAGARGIAARVSPATSVGTRQKPIAQSTNQQVLQKMQAGSPRTAAQTSVPAPPKTSRPHEPPKAGVNWGLWAFFAFTCLALLRACSS